MAISKDRPEKEVCFVVISFGFVTLISCFLLIILFPRKSTCDSCHSFMLFIRHEVI